MRIVYALSIAHACLITDMQVVVAITAYVNFQ